MICCTKKRIFFLNHAACPMIRIWLDKVFHEWWFFFKVSSRCYRICNFTASIKHESQCLWFEAKFLTRRNFWQTYEIWKTYLRIFSQMPSCLRTWRALKLDESTEQRTWWYYVGSFFKNKQKSPGIYTWARGSIRRRLWKILTRCGFLFELWKSIWMECFKSLSRVCSCLSGHTHVFSSA